MARAQNGEPTLLIADAAVLLGVSRRTVYYWIRDQRLETVRTRGGSQRVLLSSIARQLRAQRGLPPIDEEPLTAVSSDDAGSGGRGCEAQGRVGATARGPDRHEAPEVRGRDAAV